MGSTRTAHEPGRLFVFPFVFLAWGPKALTRTVIFDAGNAVTQWTLVYLLATRYGGHAADAWAVVGRLARAPPFLAIVVNRFAPTEAAGPLDVLRITGQVDTLLVVPAMGLLFEARRIAAPEVVAAVALRCGAGAAAGALIALAFDFEPAFAAVAIVGSAAPVGFSAVVMASARGSTSASRSRRRRSRRSVHCSRYRRCSPCSAHDARLDRVQAAVVPQPLPVAAPTVPFGSIRSSATVEPRACASD